MTGFETTTAVAAKGKDARIAILDESLFTGEPKHYKLFCSVNPEFISVAALDADKNRFAGFEGFHFAKPLGEEQLTRKIDELTGQSAILKKLDFRSASVLIAGNRFTLVPAAIFKPEDAEGYFYFNQPRLETDEIRHDLVRAYDAINIFSVSRQMTDALKKIFENFSVHHQMTGLLEASRRHSGNKSTKCLFLHLHASFIDVIVTEERKLIFANSFPCKGTEDGIYFVMMVCEQLSLNPEMVEVVLAGEIEKEGTFFRQLHKYLRHNSFSERSKAASFTYGFDELPAHYYHAAFNHVLCEL